MAKQRMINTKFWDDNFILELSIEEKLLFLYLLTNPLTNLCGIYEISLKRISFDTGIVKEKINKIIKKMSDNNKVHYIDGWIFISNFEKHQNLNPSVIKGIEREKACLPNKILGLMKFSVDVDKQSIKGYQVTPGQRKKVLEKHGEKCQICGSNSDIEIDHIKPIFLGGDNSIENLRPLCRKCNLDRANKDYNVNNIMQPVTGCHRLSQEGLLNLTLTKPNLTLTKPNGYCHNFESFWLKYPSDNRTNKQGCKKIYSDYCDSEEKENQFLLALDNYKQSEKYKNGYIQNSITWFRDWQTWLDYTPVKKEVLW